MRRGLTARKWLTDDHEFPELREELLPQVVHRVRGGSLGEERKEVAGRTVRTVDDLLDPRQNGAAKLLQRFDANRVVPGAEAGVRRARTGSTTSGEGGHPQRSGLREDNSCRRCRDRPLLRQRYRSFPTKRTRLARDNGRTVER